MQNVPFDVKMQGIVSMIRACAWALWLVGSLLLGGVVGGGDAECYFWGADLLRTATPPAWLIFTQP